LIPLTFYFIKVYEETKSWKYWNLVLLVIVFLVCLSYPIIIITSPPSPSDWKCINKAIDLNKEFDLPIKNDWSFGYWLNHVAGYQITSLKGGYSPQDITDFNHSIALTPKVLDCEIVCESSWWKTYHCN